MRALQAIAINTFREAIRDRVLYLLLFFGVLLILGSEAISVLAVGASERVAMDLGLAAIGFFTAMISVFLGISLVAREISRRTVFTVVTKPIRRGVFIFGKLLGLYAVVVLLALGMTLLLFAFLWLRFGLFEPRIVGVIALMVVEDLVLAAFAVLFSSFTTPILATLLSMTVYVIGHLAHGLKMLAELPEVAAGSGRGVLMAVYYVLPNLERLNLKNHVVVGEAFPLGILGPAVYGTLYAIAVVLVAAEVFRRRDFV